MTAPSVLRALKRQAHPANVAGMARYGIRTRGALGVSIPALRAMAKEIGQDHQLALDLWASGVHEARILAGLVADPAALTEREMERWARDFDSWDVCDQVCSNLFDKTPSAWRKAVEWAGRDEEFVKRAGFVLMAALSVHDKAAPDSAFMKFMPLIRREARDERNFVKKAVNWALRQIGKRNERLRRAAVQTGKSIQRLDSRSARWIAADAIRELTSRRPAKQKAQRTRGPSRTKTRMST
ncbi:MAG TPA: DNA alkylation repair protein [Kiritimatiellia bacterium]|nr:DNA alkylation repair protein [Kiritimatiellia bacterium]HRZ11161.1 DNA alkylation repair protein [Kiritimatiellia bacterium]HSA19467.1 DNA alkylation repair protein [Kiritimatiellia bacterium]